jgi:hypothetical protein
MVNKKIKEAPSPAKKFPPKDTLFDLLLLLLPAIVEIALLAGSVLASYKTYTLSFLLLFFSYFVLPMFYIVEKRIRNKVFQATNGGLTYKDGYKAFFTSAQGGIFGIFSSFFYSFLIAVATSVFLSLFFQQMCTPFAGASDAYKTLLATFNNQAASLTELYQVIGDNLSSLSQPLTVFFSASLFLPTFFFLFVFIDQGLSNHYLAHTVLPDIDLNLSASQARALGRGSLRRPLEPELLLHVLKKNWPYYLSYTVLYALLSFLFVNLNKNMDNPYLLSLLCIMPALLSFLLGLFLNYFALRNCYLSLDELSPLLLSRLPRPLLSTIHVTFSSEPYLHGAETLLHGPFVSAEKAGTNDQNPVLTPVSKDSDYYVYRKKKPEAKTPDTSKPLTPEDIKGGIIDFSDPKTGSDKKED